MKRWVVIGGVLLIPLGANIPLIARAYRIGDCIYTDGVKGWRVKYYTIDVTGKTCDNLTESEIENNANWRRVSLSSSEVISGFWGNDSPPVLGARDDCFGVEYDTYVYLETNQTFTFCGLADDGIEMFIDGTRYPFKSQSHDDCFTIKGEEECITDPISLGPGYHYILVRYYESTGSASLSLGLMKDGRCEYPWHYTSTIRPGGVIAQYYSSIYPGEFTIKKRESVEPDINHNWGDGAPSGLSSDLFAGRFITNLIISQPGFYKFCFQYNDGIRVYLNGSLAYEDWAQHSNVIEYSFPEIAYIGGLHELVIEFFEGFDSAVLRVGYGEDCDGNPSTFTPVPERMYALPHVRCLQKAPLSCSYSFYAEPISFTFLLIPIFILLVLRFIVISEN